MAEVTGCRSRAPYHWCRPARALPWVRAPSSRRAGRSHSAIQSGRVASRPGTARSARPDRFRRPVLKRRWIGGAVTVQCRRSATRTSTGTTRTSSKTYVPATKAAVSPVGASSSRCPSASSTITSLNGPHGDRGQCPSTTRTPDVVPIPAIQPSKRSERTGDRAPERRAGPADSRPWGNTRAGCPAPLPRNDPSPWCGFVRRRGDTICRRGAASPVGVWPRPRPERGPDHARAPRAAITVYDQIPAPFPRTARQCKQISPRSSRPPPSG